MVDEKAVMSILTFLNCRCNVLFWSFPFTLSTSAFKRFYYLKLLQDLTFVPGLQMWPFKLQRVDYAGVNGVFWQPLKACWSWHPASFPFCSWRFRTDVFKGSSRWALLDSRSPTGSLPRPPFATISRQRMSGLTFSLRLLINPWLLL